MCPFARSCHLRPQIINLRKIPRRDSGPPPPPPPAPPKPRMAETDTTKLLLPISVNNKRMAKVYAYPPVFIVHRQIASHLPHSRSQSLGGRPQNRSYPGQKADDSLRRRPKPYSARVLSWH